MNMVFNDIASQNSARPFALLRSLSLCVMVVAAVLFGFALLTSGTANAQGAFGDPVVNSGPSGSGTTAGTLVAVEEEVDAGTLKIGSSSQAIVRFRNESGRNISLRDANMYPSSNVSYEITLNQCGQEPLEPGAECAIIVMIRALQEGDFRLSALVRHTGQSRLATGVIRGTVEAADDDEKGQISSDVTPQPNKVEFAELTASRPIIRSVTLRNVTTSPIDIENVYIDAPAQSGFTLRTDCDTLLPSQACIASIVWSPVVSGPTSGFLVVEHNGISRVTNVELTGEFNPESVEQATIFPNAVPGKGLLVSSLTEVDFGTAVNSLSAITVSLVNAGDAPLMIMGIELSGSDNGLKVVRRGCVEGRVLEPTEACPMTVAWSPSRIGTVLDDIRVLHSGARGILVLPVRGGATEAVSMDSKPVFRMEGVDEDDLMDSVPVLDGFVVTSLAGKHAIVSGPGGSRIVSNDTPIILGGVEWNPKITPTGVQLKNGKSEVTLVFDRSLSTKSAAGGSAVAITGGSTSEN